MLLRRTTGRARSILFGILAILWMGGLLRPAAAGQLELVSKAPRQATASHSFSPSISGDGRYVAFASGVTGLLPGHVDGNKASDVFLFDRITKTTVLVSRSSASPVVAANGRSEGPKISRDGNHVVFVSRATNLIPGQTDSQRTFDVFLYSRLTGKTALVSRSADSPTRAANAESFPVDVSMDGNLVVFTSSATNLVPGQNDRNHGDDVFTFDRRTGAVTLVSHASNSPNRAGSQPSAAYSVNMSPDGEFIVFVSVATDLVQGVNPASFGSAFLYQRSSGKAELASYLGGTPRLPISADSPRVSADGRYIVFLTWDWIPGQNNAWDPPDLFALERASGKVVQLNRSTLFDPYYPEAPLELLGLSDDGRYILVMSSATDLVPRQDETNGETDLFLFDRVSGKVRLVSHEPGSPSRTIGAQGGSISADGRYVAFVTLPNFSPPYVYPLGGDVYLFDRTSGAVTLVSRSARSASDGGDNDSGEPAISATGSFVAFTSRASNLSRQDSNGFLKDIFLYAP